MIDCNRTGTTNGTGRPVIGGNSNLNKVGLESLND